MTIRLGVMPKRSAGMSCSSVRSMAALRLTMASGVSHDTLFPATRVNPVHQITCDEALVPYLPRTRLRAFTDRVTSSPGYPTA